MPASISTGDIDGHPVRVLTSPGGALVVAFAPSVRMVGTSLRHRGEELLGQRRGLGAYARTGSTMGVPLLAPWANRLGAMRYRVGGREVELSPEQPGMRLDPHGLPIHGLLAASPDWEVVEERAADDRARLAARLDFGVRRELLEAFPFPHDVVQEVELGDGGLAITTTVRATGGVDVPVSFGHHPTCGCRGSRARGGRSRSPSEGAPSSTSAASPPANGSRWTSSRAHWVSASSTTSSASSTRCPYSCSPGAGAESTWPSRRAIRSLRSTHPQARSSSASSP